jgi:cobalt/nickel transport system permease protein
MNTDLMMHIPDGFLSAPTSGLFWLISAAIIVFALRRAEKELDERRLPMMGLMAAAIFAAQMLNFAVTGGTSGHLLGSALAVILLGPWSAVLVMASVVVVQALVFQDGGLLALGANLFNMAVVGVAMSFFVVRIINRLGNEKRWAIMAGAFGAGWLSIFIASLVAALQLAVSGTSPANIALPAMGGIHALIGIGEGLITAAAAGVVLAARPEVVRDQYGKKSEKSIWLVGMLLSVLLVVFAPLASSHPDGLEWVAEELGFMHTAREPLFELIPDYVFPGIGNEALATIVAGVIGVVIVTGVALATARRKSTGKTV